MERPFGDYILLERIGAGGMGEVFRARKTGPDGFSKEVAVKLILPHLSREESFRSLFSREARLAAGLKHPNIVDIHGFALVGETAVIEMELVEGADLRLLLRGLPPGGKLPLSETALILHRVARGLAHAHSPRGAAPALVHRDLNPQNILLSREGEVKVADFGIARAAEEGTTGGGLKGKALYMSPEQARGEDLTPASDLFALGTLAYQLLTGRHPFDKGGEAAALSAIAAARYDPIGPEEGVPPELAALTADLLQADRLLRPSAEKAAQVLDPFVRAQAERDLEVRIRGLARSRDFTHPPSLTAATIPPRKNRWPLAAGGAIAAALALWLAYGLAPRPQQTPSGPMPLPPAEGARPAPAPAPEAVPAQTVQAAVSAPGAYTVIVATSPPGALILEGGSPLGQSPLKVRIDRSDPERRLTARLDGYSDRDFLLSPISTSSPVSFALSPLPTGRVRIGAIPWAIVHYGGKTVGETPLVADHLPAGRRTLMLENAALGVKREVSVDVRAGETVTLNVDLTSPLP